MWEWLYQQKLSWQCHGKAKGMLHTIRPVKTQHHGLANEWGIAVILNEQQQKDLSLEIKLFANGFVPTTAVHRDAEKNYTEVNSMNENEQRPLRVPEQLDHSCAQMEVEFWTSILYLHMCDAVSLPAWEVKTEFLPQGQQETQIQDSICLQIWSQYCKNRAEKDHLHQYTMAQHWAKCIALLKASKTRFRLIIYALYLHVKDVGCSGLLVSHTDEKAIPCWQLKSQMRKCCKSLLYRRLNRSLKLLSWK